MTPPIRTTSFSLPQNLGNENVQQLRDDTNVQQQSHLGNQLNPQAVPVSPRNGIVQCLKGEKMPSELNLRAPAEGGQDQKGAVADAVAKIAAKLSEGIPQQATTLGFALGEGSVVELRTDGEGGVFVSVDGGKEARIDAQSIPANLAERVQLDQKANPALYSEQTDLPAQTKAVVDAFADLISGKKVPSKMTIVDPITNQTSEKLKLDLAKAAVKLSTALMFLPPGEETSMGFSVGDSILEVRRDNFGSFFVSIDGSSEKQVPVDDIKLGLANNLALDMLDRTDLYGKVDLGITKPGAKPQQLALANLSVIISAANASAKSPLGRDIYEKALNLKFGLKPEDLSGLGLNGLRQVAMKALEGGYKNVAAAKNHIAQIVKGSPLERLDIVNSPEASKEIVEIQELLEERPEEVQQKTDISRINVRSRDPQAGMTAEQKQIHNLIADLFMPSDSRLYETNQGQGANRIRQTLLAHPQAVSLIVKAKLAGEELPLGSLPGTMRAAVQGAIDKIADECIKLYRSTAVTADSTLNPPKSPLDAIVQALKGEKLPSELNLKAEPGLGNAQQVKNAVAETIRNISQALSQGIPQHATTMGFSLGTNADGSMIADSTVEVRTDGAGGVFISVDGGAEVRIDAQSIPADLAARVQSDAGNVNSLNGLPDLVNGAVDGKRLDAALRQLDMAVLGEVDRTLENAIDTLAKDQQQILNAKLESSINGIKQAKEQAAQQGNDWDLDIAAMRAQKVTAQKGTPEYNKQLAGLMKEIYFGVRDLYRAVEDSDQKSEDGEAISAIQVPGSAKALFSQMRVMMSSAGVKTPGNWFSADGKAILDDFFTKITPERILEFLDPDQMEKLLDSLTAQPNVPENGGKQYPSSYAQQTAQILEDAKELGYDFRPSLAQMANEAEDFDKPGMGMFTKKVLMSYFSGDVKLPENATAEQIKTAEQINAGRQIDKRSMLAALVRYSTSGVSETAQLGAMLKGGGPLLHKLLQNFNMPGIDPDFRTALDDMKSNLAPIEPSFVQAQLLQIVNNSKGAIQNIKIDKALGAASVAQTFLVTVTPTDPNQAPYKAAVKIIRPDVKVRTEREVEHFKLAAEGIPGMKESYLGLYSQYQKEFDLRLEAENIAKGAEVYNDGVDETRMSSVGLVEGVAPSANALIMKLAPGESLDVYLGNMKARLEELRSREPKSFAELLQYKLDLRALYQELHDANKSLGTVANKWLNKAIFTSQGFFHGDLHAGNMMIQRKDPNDPESVAHISLIDYGNATALTKEQTDAIFKVNVACVFGGVYEHDITEDKKQLVDTKTTDMFVAGLKGLLPPEELAKFEANEKHLRDDVIRPILLRGSASEMGDRMTVLLTHLQREGIAIPGPIMNFAQSQMRLNGAMTDLEALLVGADALLKSFTLDVAGSTDPVGAEITHMTALKQPLGVRTLQKIIPAYEYNLNPSQQQLDQWKLDSTRGPQEGEAPEAYQLVKADAEKNLQAYNNAQKAQQKTGMMVLDAFGRPTGELWGANRLTQPDVGVNGFQIFEVQLGNYLKQPQDDPKLYELHQQFLAVKSQIDPKVYEEFREAERLLIKDSGRIGEAPKNLNPDELAKHNQALSIVQQFGQTELGKELLRIRDEAANEINPRIAQIGKAFVQNFREGDATNNPGSPQLGPQTSLVTETLRTVQSNVGNVNQAMQFGSKMGMGFFDMGAVKLGVGDWYNYLTSTMQGVAKHSKESFDTDL